MKNLFILLFFFAGILGYSQTISETWNSIYNRYDYTDSNGTLVGYKGYNSITQAWEYTSTNVPDPRINQSNEYQSPIDLNLMGRAAKARRNNNIAAYNANVERVRTEADNIRNSIINSNSPKASKILDRFEKEVISQIRGKKFNYTSSEDTNQIIHYLYSNINKIIEQEK